MESQPDGGITFLSTLEKITGSLQKSARILSWFDGFLRKPPPSLLRKDSLLHVFNWGSFNQIFEASTVWDS